MTPIVVTAHLRGALREPGMAGTSPALLDGLLLWALAQELGIPAVHLQSPAERAESEGRLTAALPLARERGIWLASDAQWAPERYEVRYQNRRFPAVEAVALGGPKLKRVELSTGLSKSYHIPVREALAAGDRVAWFAMGAGARILALLSWVQHLGKKRAIGCGPVLRWEVAPCEPWPGFPVLREGAPLRPLPLDWPGLTRWTEDYRVLSPPYWERHREELCACP